MQQGVGPNPPKKGGFLEGSNPAPWERAINSDSACITRQNAINVPFSLHTHTKMAKEEALLDSGAMHNFIDKRMAKRLGIGTKKLENPRKIRNVDGTDNQAGELTKYTDLKTIVDKDIEVL